MTNGRTDRLARLVLSGLLPALLAVVALGGWGVVPPVDQRDPGHRVGTAAARAAIPATPPRVATPAPAAAVPAPGADTGPDRSAAGLTAADAAGDGLPDDHVAVAVLDTVTGQVASDSDGDEPFELASVVKLATCVDVLRQGETGRAAPTADDRDLVTRALSDSDDGAMDALWETYGGFGTVSDLVDPAGLTQVEAPRDPSNWGETAMSARDVAAVYRYAATALTPPDRDLVLGAMRAAPDTASDGTDQAYGLLHEPRGDAVAAKQGWMWDGEVYAHSTGLAGPGARYAVAVLTRQSSSYDTAFSDVTTVTSALTDALGPPVR